MKDDNAMKVAFDLCNDAMAKIGRSYPVQGTGRARLEAAGFVDVHEVLYKQPLAPWPRDKK